MAPARRSPASAERSPTTRRLEPRTGSGFPPAHDLINAQFKGGAFGRTSWKKDTYRKENKDTGPYSRGWWPWSPRETRDVQSDMQLHGRMVTRALARLPDYTGTRLYRGQQGGASWLSSTLSYKALTSTSKWLHRAYHYASGRNSTFLVIKGPIGGKDVSEITGTGLSLGHVLVPPGLKLKIDERTTLEKTNKATKDKLKQQLGSLTTMAPEERESLASEVKKAPPTGNTLTVYVAKRA